MQIKLIGNSSATELDITPTPRILQVLENLAVEPWRCLAEFIDNSLDDFRKTGKEDGEISISYEEGKLIVSDNGSGMSPKQLENALRAGFSSKSKIDELGLFGIGFNVACANLGRRANVITKRVEETGWTSVVIDIVELTKKNTFKIQPQKVVINGFGDSGTVVVIDLKTELAVNFERSKYAEGIRKNLGRAYSYILRGSIPGLTGPLTGNARPVSITISGKSVKPFIPCIWSEDRSVSYRNQAVQAVEKFRRDLPDSSVCNNCGYWSENSNVKHCGNCGSSDVSISHRQITGWIGIQRYMDGIEFGLDFIRNGRTILSQDKDIFTFTDPNTGESMKDYPVEWPADKGRIVGEVHLDHVRVDFIKKAFDRNDPYWAGAISVIRGDSSLQPKRALERNVSPLSKIFNAFRINEPGSNYLIPGNGTKAIHDATKNWAVKFHEGDPDYSSDQKWFEAVQSHDRIAKSGKSNSTSAPGAVATPGVLNPLASPSTNALPKEPPKKESLNDMMKRLEAGGVMRMDLSKNYQVAAANKIYRLDVWETISEIIVDGRERHIWAHIVKGAQINVYISSSSELFLRFRRGKTDLALIEAAQLIKGLSSSNASISEIYFDLLKQLPDEEYSELILRSRIEEMRVRILGRLETLVAANPEPFAKALSSRTLEIAEENSSSLFPKIKWSEIRKSGRLALCLPIDGVRELIENLPEQLFDGKLFSQHYATAHAPKARERTQGYTVKVIQDLAEIKASNNHLNDYELSLCEISLSFLNQMLVADSE